MKEKNILYVVGALFVIGILSLITNLGIRSLEENDKASGKNKILTEKKEVMVLSVDDSSVTVKVKDNSIYQLQTFSKDLHSGDTLLLEYTGVLDPLAQNNDVKIVSYDEIEVEKDSNGIPLSWKNNGIFSSYYVMAFNKLKELSLEEKIGQLLLVRYPDSNATNILNTYKLGGFVFYEKDFRDKTKQQVQNMIDNLQEASKIPLLTAVDEEGGTVVRISSNPNLSAEKFKSSQELYKEGGFDAITNDTLTKSKLLSDLGLNLNLAPVVDVATDPNSYIYPRTFGGDTASTSTYARTVIEASKNTGVSYTLKHFPGYGNSADTHTGSVTNNRDYNDILNNDFPPFQAGIDAGAEAILVNHNIVTNIDDSNPASLSPAVHNILRENMKFTGVIMTDDISMGALDSVDNVTVKAILAGNDIIITTDYAKSFNDIKNAVNSGDIGEEVIDQLAFRVLSWKYSKGLMNSK